MYGRHINSNYNNSHHQKLILLQNHGIICPGSSIKECIVATKMCEKSAEIFVGCHEIGSINYFEREKPKADLTLFP